MQRLVRCTHPDAVEYNVGRPGHLVNGKRPVQRVSIGALVTVLKHGSSSIGASICGGRGGHIRQVVDGCFAHIAYPVSLQSLHNSS